MDLTFNHAMIYTRDVQKSLDFYHGALGFDVLQEFRGGPRLVYARLRPLGSEATIALHLLEPGTELRTGGVRLYFEVERLEEFCAALEAKGIRLTKPPALMPWGWRHAYLDDPDGHEVSLYWAGPQRLERQ